jgi:ubiquinol-cytochrome c reductase cytochrome c1 subunit
MLRKAAILAVAGFILGSTTGAALAATSQEEPKEATWSFEGPFGKFDQEQLQRGYKVYHDVCSACHAMSQLHYYDLGASGGPFADPDKYPNPNNNPRVKALAAEVKIADIDSDTGDTVQRPGTTADKLKPPFANEAAARASNGGALPPDLSLIVKAREGGARYVYSILTGYVPAPAGLTVPAGKSYNPYMPGDLGAFWSGPKDKVPKGGFISMPFQLTPDRVTFDDGVKATTEQEAKDVVAFLAWASEPHQVERKQMGFSVLIYLLILAGLVYASYRKVWRKVDH